MDSVKSLVDEQAQVCMLHDVSAAVQKDEFSLWSGTGSVMKALRSL